MKMKALYDDLSLKLALTGLWSAHMHAHRAAPPSNILAAGYQWVTTVRPSSSSYTVVSSNLCPHLSHHYRCICMDICACMLSCTHFRLARTSSTWFLGEAAQWSRGIPWHACMCVCVCVRCCCATVHHFCSVRHDCVYSIFMY